MATIQNPQRNQEFLNVEANESSERILTSSNDPMIHDERCAMASDSFPVPRLGEEHRM